MTKKDYIAVARILSTVTNKRERQRLAEEFAAWFRQDNPQFDVERFSSAVFEPAYARATRKSADRRPSRRSRR
jgi:hypothetical protein